MAELTLEENNQSCKTKMMDFQWFQNYQSPEYISDQQFQNYSPTMTPYEGYIGAEDTPLNEFFNDNYSQQGTSPGYSVSEESVDDDDRVIGDLFQMPESEMIDYIISPYNPFSEVHRLPNEFPFISSITDDSELVVDPSITTLIPQTIKEIDVVDNTAEEKVEESNDEVPLRKVVETAKCRPKKVAKPRKPRKPRRSNSRANRSIHLWEFLRELLNNGTSNSIQWISKKDGTFRLVNSSAVAKLWGQRKNRQNMTYEKMSRALRYYYEKQILERVPNARLIYKFGNRTKPTMSEDSLSDSSVN